MELTATTLPHGTDDDYKVRAGGVHQPPKAVDRGFFRNVEDPRGVLQG